MQLRLVTRDPILQLQYISFWTGHCIPQQAFIPTNGETLRINAPVSEFVKYECRVLFLWQQEARNNIKTN